MLIQKGPYFYNKPSSFEKDSPCIQKCGHNPRISKVGTRWNEWPRQVPIIEIEIGRQRNTKGETNTSFRQERFVKGPTKTFKIVLLTKVMKQTRMMLGWCFLLNGFRCFRWCRSSSFSVRRTSSGIQFGSHVVIVCPTPTNSSQCS